MKINATGGFGFTIKIKQGVIACGTDAESFVSCSPDGKKKGPADLHLWLPGEAEIQEVLIKGVQTRKGNTAYTFYAENMHVAYFGDFHGEVSKEFYKELGENIDVALIMASEAFNPKKIDAFLDVLSPRMAIVATNGAHISALTSEMGATAAEGVINVKKSALSEENTEVLFVVNE